MESEKTNSTAAPKRRAACSGRRCGQCNACLDDARWERIFQEKFADPDYYARGPRNSSPIGSFSS